MNTVMLPAGGLITAAARIPRGRGAAVSRPCRRGVGRLRLREQRCRIEVAVLVWASHRCL